mmetsp:Transcript_15105/g.46092  ORF Transcript_15105/g.46092 Transcript_15105/m.46092 type:complete len:205 (-) Transcript_15105:1895-2509(-)
MILRRQLTKVGHSAFAAASLAPILLTLPCSLFGMHVDSWAASCAFPAASSILIAVHTATTRLVSLLSLAILLPFLVSWRQTELGQPPSPFPAALSIVAKAPFQHEAAPCPSLPSLFRPLSLFLCDLSSLCLSRSTRLLRGALTVALVVHQAAHRGGLRIPFSSPSSPIVISLASYICRLPRCFFHPKYTPDLSLSLSLSLSSHS